MKIKLGWPILMLLCFSLGLLGYFVVQNNRLSQKINEQRTTPPVLSPFPSPIPTQVATGNKCVDKTSLKCASENELSYECSPGYQNWAKSNCPGWEENIFCGGIAGKECPAGYSCKLDGTYPDASGNCIKTAEKIPGLTSAELEMGWYYGSSSQKKPGTPSNWIYTEAGKSSCWHEPAIKCGFLPD